MQLKKIIRETPVIGPLTIKVAHKLGYKRPKNDYTFNRITQEGESNLTKIQNLLNYTKTSESFYAATNFPAGYHTLTIGGKTFKGRRNPKARLEKVPFDFADKSVLDIGSNQGGMLFELKDDVKWGVGIDYDPRMINAANKIKAVESYQHLSFYHFNLESDSLELIEDLLPENKVDIIFLLAVCRWIKNWKEVIRYCAYLSDTLLIETNGTLLEQEEQIKFVKQLFSKIEVISLHSVDDPERNDRQLYLCKK